MRKHIKLAFIAVLLLGTAVMSGQATDPETSENKPVRVTGYPQGPVLGGPQGPPYDKMGTFISNAFVTINDEEVFIQDSSVCSTGVAGTTDYKPALLAVYAFDNDQVMSITFSRIDQEGMRQLYSRKQFTFSDEGLSEYLYSRWNQGWVPEYRERTMYTGERLASVTSQVKTSGDWQNDQRTTFVYGDGNLVQYSVEEWSDGNWTVRSRLVAAYNANDLVTSVLHLFNRDGSLDTISRETYDYDPFLDFTTEGYLLEEYDDGSGSFVPVRREEYEENLRGFYSGRIVQSWSDTTGWQNMFRDEFDYTALGVWRQWTRQRNESAGGNLFNREFKFSEAGQLDVIQVWDADAAEWRDSIRQLAQFDEYGNLIRERSGVVKTTEGVWENGPDAMECRHFWSEFTTTSAREIMGNAIDCVLANPLPQGSLIQCLNLVPGSYTARLYDQLGRAVFTRQFSAEESFSMDSDLPTGIYYLLVHESNKILYRRKVAVQN